MARSASRRRRVRVAVKRLRPLPAATAQDRFASEYAHAMVPSGFAACPQTSLFTDRKSTRLNSSHDQISYAVVCLKKKKTNAAGNAAIPNTLGIIIDGALNKTR